MLCRVLVRAHYTVRVAIDGSQALEALGEGLLEQETIDGPDAVRLMEQHGLPAAGLAA